VRDDTKAKLEGLELARAKEGFERGTAIGLAKQVARSAAAQALAQIPYAGGTFADLFGKMASKKEEEIADTLRALTDAVLEHDAKIEDVLEPEEVVEIISETVPRMMRTSRDEKLQFFKHGLITTFTDDEMSYDMKHEFMSMLDALTYVQIRVLRLIYAESDPFETTDYVEVPEPTEPEAQGRPFGWEPATPQLQFHPTEPLWLQRGSDWTQGTSTGISGGVPVRPRTFKEWRSDGALGTLAGHIARRLKDDADAMDSAAARLDALGLTNLRNTLGNSQYRVFEQKRRPAPSGGEYSFGLTAITAPSMQFGASQVSLGVGMTPKATPIEEARTKLGERFMEFVGVSVRGVPSY
jgi:transcription termination factor NusB